MTDYSKMASADINIRMKSMENEYDLTKTQVMYLINELKTLDKEYLLAKNELSKRGVLNDEQ